MSQFLHSTVGELSDPQVLNIQYRMRSVSASTRVAYKRSWALWTSFLESASTSYLLQALDPFLTKAPSDTVRSETVTAFLRWCTDEGRPINGLLCGVAFFFRCCNHSAAVFGDAVTATGKRASERIRKEAAATIWNSGYVAPESAQSNRDQPVLAVAYSVIEGIRENVVQAPSIDGWMCYLALALCYTFGLRPSEFSHGSSKEVDHSLRSHGVVFFAENGCEYAPWETTGLKIEGGWWSDGTSRIVKAKFTWASTKTLMHRGKAIDHFLDGTSSSDERIFLHDLIQFTRVAGLERGDVFFSRCSKRGDGGRKRLTTKECSTLLKDECSRQGYPEGSVSLRGCRYAFATTLEMNGNAPEEVQHAGQWGSLECSKGYQRPNIMRPTAMGAACKGVAVSVGDGLALRAGGLQVGKAPSSHAAVYGEGAIPTRAKGSTYK